MSVNLNGTTPAAPTNNTNVTFQVDGSGNVSAYVPTSVAEVAAVDLTAQAANISGTTLLATTASGLYKVSAYIVVTQVATTSSTLPSVVISWTDQDNGIVQSITLTPTNAGNVLTTYQEGVAVISAVTASNIQYSTTGYLSSGATPMQYALHVRLEKF